MSNNPPSATPAEVVVLDNSPPRRHPSSPSPSNEVIVLDQSPPVNPTSHINSPAEPIMVEENPPKRRRRDNPAAHPLHTRSNASTEDNVIIVEDDDDTSDPESLPASANPASFPSITPVAPPQTHVRLPRMNTRRNVRIQDDIIEMSGSGPGIDRTASSPAPPHVASWYPPPTPPTRTRHTSMPPLFSFTRSSTLGPQVTPPTQPPISRSVPIHIPAHLLGLVTPRQSTTSTTTARQTAFPQPLPEQALPSTGRRATRSIRRHVSFSESLRENGLSAGARATLSVLRELENEGIHGTGPPTGLPRQAPEPVVQATNGPAVYYDSTHSVTLGAAPSPMANNRVQRQTGPSRETPFVPTTNNLRRRQARALRRRAPAVTTVAPPLSRAGVHRAVGFPPQGMSRAHIQQLNALHAASNGMSLQEDGLSFLAETSGSTTNTSLPSSHRMIVTANLRNSSAAPRAAVDAAAAAAVAAATAVTHLPTAGLTVSSTQVPMSYGQGSFAVPPSSSTTTARHRMHTGHTTSHRHTQTVRRFQRILRITGSPVAAGIEIQYLQGMHGDRALDYEQLIRLDEQLIREKNRADTSQIEALPIKIATSEDKEIRCCVCMCDVEEGEELRVLPCSHKYHKKCIDEWLTYNGCCPVDKKRIAPRQTRPASGTS